MKSAKAGKNRKLLNASIETNVEHGNVRGLLCTCPCSTTIIASKPRPAKPKAGKRNRRRRRRDNNKNNRRKKEDEEKRKKRFAQLFQ